MAEPSCVHFISSFAIFISPFASKHILFSLIQFTFYFMVFFCEKTLFFHHTNPYTGITQTSKRCEILIFTLPSSFVMHNNNNWMCGNALPAFKQMDMKIQKTGHYNTKHKEIEWYNRKITKENEILTHFDWLKNKAEKKKVVNRHRPRVNISKKRKTKRRNELNEYTPIIPVQFN